MNLELQSRSDESLLKIADVRERGGELRRMQNNENLREIRNYGDDAELIWRSLRVQFSLSDNNNPSQHESIKKAFVCCKLLIEQSFLSAQLNILFDARSSLPTHTPVINILIFQF